MAPRANSPADVTVIAADSDQLIALVHDIRRRVFIEEQHVPEEIELDAADSAAWHVLAMSGGRALGCGRMVEEGDCVRIGRMAVLAASRGRGVGRAILTALTERARGRGFKRAVLHAQVTAEGFYLRAGFVPTSGVFDEAGIAHRTMERAL